VLKQCQESTTSVIVLEKQMWLSINLGLIIKPFPNYVESHHSTERKIIHKWKSYRTVVNLPRSGPTIKLTTRSDCAMLRETAKNPRTTFQTLQASVSMLNVNVLDSTIRKD